MSNKKENEESSPEVADEDSASKKKRPDGIKNPGSKFKQRGMEKNG